MIAIAAVLLMQASIGNPRAGSSGRRAIFRSPVTAGSRGGAIPNGWRRPVCLFRKALQLKPDWAEGLWEAGSIEYDQDQYKECSADSGNWLLKTGPSPWLDHGRTL